MEEIKKRGGRRPGSGRKQKEKTITTGFRINEDNLNYLRSIKYPLNAKINSYIKKLVERLKSSYQ